MLCKGSFPPERPIVSLAAQMSMRYQAVEQRWRDDATKERHSVVVSNI
jgi:hypothetical protein